MNECNKHQSATGQCDRAQWDILLRSNCIQHHQIRAPLVYLGSRERTGERKVRKGHSVANVRQMGDLADDVCSWVNQTAFKWKSRWWRKEWCAERVHESNYSACAVHLDLEAKQLWYSCITRWTYSSSILAAWSVPAWIHKGLLIWNSKSSQGEHCIWIFKGALVSLAASYAYW